MHTLALAACFSKITLTKMHGFNAFPCKMQVCTQARLFKKFKQILPSDLERHVEFTTSQLSQKDLGS